jgi:hypothetical protein
MIIIVGKKKERKKLTWCQRSYVSSPFRHSSSYSPSLVVVVVVKLVLILLKPRTEMSVGSVPLLVIVIEKCVLSSFKVRHLVTLLIFLLTLRSSCSTSTSSQHQHRLGAALIASRCIFSPLASAMFSNEL